MSMTYDKVPPQAIDHEEKVLGWIMFEPKTLFSIIKYYTPDVFYLDKHQHIYGAIVDLHQENEPISTISVKRKLQEKNLLEDVGGAYYLSILLSHGSIDITNFENYSRKVFEDYIRRCSIQHSGDILNKSFDIGIDVFDIIDMYNSFYQKLMTQIDKPEMRSNELVSDFIDNVINFENATDVQFIKRSIGIPALDNLVRWSPNKLFLLAGGAKDGKTKLVSHIVWQLLRDNNDTSVLWVTLEDTPQDILTSFCSSIAKVKPKDIIERNTSKEQKFKITEGIDEWKKWDIEFVSNSISINEIKTKMSVFCNKRPKRFNILVIDNLMSLSDKYQYTRNPNAFYDVVFGVVADIRRDTNAFIFLLHHLKDEYNDASNVDTGFRPKMTDAKGSEANSRVPNYMFLINNPSKKNALLNKYNERQRFVLERLMILDPAVIRDETKIGDKTLVRLYSNLDYNIFKGL